MGKGFVGEGSMVQAFSTSIWRWAQGWWRNGGQMIGGKQATTTTTLATTKSMTTMSKTATATKEKGRQ